jgi:cell division protein FtsI (penicillin-binding protein 3)
MTAPRPSDATTPAGISRLRPAVVHLGLVLFGAAIVAKAAQLQVVEHRQWATKAEEQHVAEKDVTPARGPILDATGSVLVESREEVEVQIASHELLPTRLKGPDGKRHEVDTRAVVRQGLKELGVPDSTIRKALRRQKQWVTLPMRFIPADLKRFDGLPGVRRTRAMRRVMTAPDGIKMLVGAIRPDGTPNSGLEAELDEYLRGEEGHDQLVRDGRGRGLSSPMLERVAARPGYSITLTINQALQEITEQKLKAALDTTGATGGDVVIIDPRDGAVLAMAGWRDRKPAPAMTALTEAYEPGSVMKPFVISRILDLKLARPEELVNTENGLAMIAGRKLTDEHKAPQMTVRDIVRQSSNIGTAKLSQRLSYAQHYQALRDFGFGTPTGLPYPAESRGVLKVPAKWGTMTQTSSAIGYEVMATPMQLATAYTAFANDGEVLEPTLVREMRDDNDRIVYTHQRRVLRRAVSPAGAELMRVMLKSVVDSGTARGADMQTFDVGGKSGTARRKDGGAYRAGAYNSSFAGMFPIEDPQYVVVARLIDSKNGFFGGTVAGGLVRNILAAALATREVSLDRAALAKVRREMPAPPPKPLTPAQRLAMEKDSLRRDSLKAPPPPKAEPLAGPARVLVDLAVPATVERVRAATDMRPVPSVFGLDPRQAARTLYAAGFQVSLAAGKAVGRDVRTRPAAGVMMRAGSTVQLETPK